VVRDTDTLDTLTEKVELATILGTFQASLTDLKGLRKKWLDNIVDEALLGVSLTGIMDNVYTNGSGDLLELETTLDKLRKHAINTNKEWSDKLGINQAAAITAVKPSGTVSQLVDSASGIHSRHNPYYIRRVRADAKDPLALLMEDQGIPCEADIMKPDSVKVFSFPTKSPEEAICRTDRTAIEQLELWLTYQRHWCEHKPSVTISVKEKEWMEVGSWVYEHFDEVSGVSFLPFSEHNYQQAPYEDITEEQYEELLKAMPESIDWSLITQYELEDMTKGTKELACSAGGGVCEVVDLVSDEQE
jgi:ribonucleoside-triphosphate reductase (thioredoxin)